MTDLIWLFNGTDGTTATTALIKSGPNGDGTTATTVSPSTGTITFSATQVQQGTTSLKIDCPASVSPVTRLPFSAGHTVGGMSIYQYGTTVPSGEKAFLTLRSATGQILAFTWNNGFLRLKQGSTILATATGTALSASTFIRHAITYTINGTTSSVSWKAYAGDTSTIIDQISYSGSADLGTAQAVAIDIGAPGSGTSSWTQYFDSVVLRDGAATDPGPYLTPQSPVYPILTDSATSWTNTGGTLPAILADNDNATYTVNPGVATNEVASFKLGYLSSGNVKVDVDLALDTGQPATIVKCELLQGAGGTVIATWSDTIVSTTQTTLSRTLTSGENSAITDRSDLHLRITVNA